MGRLRDMLAESQQNSASVREMRDEIRRLGGDLGVGQRTLHALQVDRERMQSLFQTASEEVQSLESELDSARSANVMAAKAIEDVIRSTRGEQAGAKMITSKLEDVERHVSVVWFELITFFLSARFGLALFFFGGDFGRIFFTFFFPLEVLLTFVCASLILLSSLSHFVLFSRAVAR